MVAGTGPSTYRTSGSALAAWGMPRADTEIQKRVLEQPGRDGGHVDRGPPL